MKTGENFYICPVCFQVCDSQQECHAHRMVECAPGKPGDERRKPVTNRFGRYASRAPRWYLEAIGRMPPSQVNSIQPGR
jgi:hypothetical protein